MGQSSNSNGDLRLASIYLGRFDDSVRSDTLLPEFIDLVAVHELCHPFIKVPTNISPYFDGLSHYNYLSSSQTQNGMKGYCEIYDPLNAYANNYSALRELYSCPLSQMCLGIRSKYEDMNLMVQGGTFDNSYFTEEWNYSDTTTSSKYFYEYRDEKKLDYWNLHWNSPKIDLPDTAQELLIPKSEQENRSLLVYASDSLHPGYFKCYSLGAKSSVSVIENITTGIKGQLAIGNWQPRTQLLIPNPCRDIGRWMRRLGEDARLFDLTGRQMPTGIIKPGVYLIHYNGFLQRVVVLRY